jgi:hypothetical protein
VETLSGRDIEKSALDLAIFFFYVSKHLSYQETSIHPKFILELISKLTANENIDKESIVHSINKYTLSMILNQYHFASGVDPAFVQYIFSSMQSVTVMNTPEIVMNIRQRHIGDLSISFIPLTQMNDMAQGIFQTNSVDENNNNNTAVKHSFPSTTSSTVSAHEHYCQLLLAGTIPAVVTHMQETIITKLLLYIASLLSKLAFATSSLVKLTLCCSFV